MYRNVDQYYTHTNTHTHTHTSLTSTGARNIHIEGWNCHGCLRQAMTLPRSGRGISALTTSQGKGWRVENGEWLLGFEASQF